MHNEVPQKKWPSYNFAKSDWTTAPDCKRVCISFSENPNKFKVSLVCCPHCGDILSFAIPGVLLNLGAGLGVYISISIVFYILFLNLIIIFNVCSI